MPGYAQRIVNKEISLNDLQLDTLCILTLVIYEITENITIDPTKYFTQKEIKKSKQMAMDKNIKDKYPVIFDNTIQMSIDDYMTIITAKDIVDLFESVLEYNFETQREPQIRRRKNAIIKEPKLNSKSVKEIAYHALNNTLIPSILTFNVLLDGNDDIEYDINKSQLIIKSGEIDILDGLHRISGIVRAYYQNPELVMRQISFAL